MKISNSISAACSMALGTALTISVIIAPLNASADIPAGKKVIGYLPDYRLDDLQNINFTNVTHVVYFSLDADTNGNLVAISRFTTGLPYVVATVHGKGKKVSVCVGGWLTDDYFKAIARSTTARANFVSQIVAFCRNNGLDGVDLDWEPIEDVDVPYYAILIRELDAALSPYGLLLSAAVNASHYDIPASAATNLDWVSVMAYDMNYPHADHSTYNDSVACMNFWLQSGIPASKLVMGVPFFGLNEGWVDAITYSDIVDLYNPGPDVNNIGGFGFNGVNLIKAKTTYAMNSGFAGMSIWELGQDKFDSRSLLTVLATTISSNATATAGTVVSTALPAPWKSVDIGTCGLIGSASVSSNVYTVSGAGAIYNDRYDSFQFAYQTLSADGEIKVRVPSQTASDSAARAGVMIRDSLNANAKYVMLDVMPSKIFGLMYRTSTGGKAGSSRSGNMYAAPNNWVRLVRSGSKVTAYKSIDGITWSQVTSMSITLNSSCYIGLAVCGQSTTSLNRATFDKLVVVP